MMNKYFNGSCEIGIIGLQNNTIVHLDNNSRKMLDCKGDPISQDIEKVILDYNIKSNEDNEVRIENIIIKDSIIYAINIPTGKSKDESLLILIKNKEKNESLERNELLRFLIEYLHDDLCITDGQGKVLRVSKSWEEKHYVKANDVLGVDIGDLERAGIFKPSVTLKVLAERRRTEILQYNKKGEKILASGVPIFDDQGNIRWVISYSSWEVTNSEMLKVKNEELENLIKIYSAEIEELRRKNMKVPHIVFESPQMKSIVNLIKRIAPLDINLLITGETGVGKNLIAKTIHQISDRYKEPFIEINCGAIPENLIESELFGYEEGAFTGARQNGKVGLIELANNGTLFLDEIAELSSNLQVKLLKVLQDRVITRIGGTKPIEVDFRLITATNRDIIKLVDNKDFRSDLYYRISVVPIHIPPIRDRREDLKELIEVLFIKANEKYNLKKMLSNQAMNVLMSYSWPGNVRELENAIEQIVVTSMEDCILPIHIPDNILLLPKAIGQTGINLKAALEHYEGQLIMNAYEKYKTTVGVSKALGISQPTAARKIAKYSKESEMNNSMHK